MRSVRAFFVRLGGCLRRSRREQELNDEIDSHLQLHIDDNVRAGMSPDEARRQAVLKLGGVETVKEAIRDRQGLPWLENFARDFRYALRMLRKSPVFTAVAILSLALGIGANAAVFTLIDRLLLRMLPVRQPERFFSPEWSNDRFKGQSGFSLSAYEAFRDDGRVFSDLLCRRNPFAVGLRVGDVTEQTTVEAVSGNYFSMLGVVAALGRVLQPDDQLRSGDARVAILSFESWQRRFGGDHGVLGRVIHLNTLPFVVVGVCQERFNGLDPGYSPEVRVPLTALFDLQTGWNEKSRTTERVLTLLGRLRPEVAELQAEGILDVLHRRALQEMIELAGNFPDDYRRRTLSSRIELRPAGRGLFGLGDKYRDGLPILMGGAGLLLLIACVNLATLLLAKAPERQREIAVRISLGAGRGRILRQLFTENLLLAVCGGALAALISSWLARALASYIPQTSQWRIVLPTEPDWRVWGFLAAVTLLTTLLFGLAPAFQATRLELSAVMKDATGGAPRRFRGSRALISLQVALSLVLLAGAGLLVRTLRNLVSTQTGFEGTRSVVTFNLDPGLSGYTPERSRAFFQDAVERIAAIPGVQSASLDRFGPLGRPFGVLQMATQVEGYQAEGDEASNPRLAPHRFVVGPEYFRTAGIHRVLGREFTLRDHEKAPKVAIVNEQFARYYFGSENPIGRHMGWGKLDHEIIGVVKDAKYYEIREEPLRVWYVPFAQTVDRSSSRASVLVRTAGDPARAIVAVRRELHAIDANVPVTAVKTVEAQIDERLSNERLLTHLLAGFALLSAALVAIGLYGVMACSVARRTREIGVRMALGADSTRVFLMVIRESSLVVALGLLLGVPAALAACRVAASILYGVTPGDVISLSGAALVMGAVALAAACLPARRATKVDPIVALRAE